MNILIVEDDRDSAYMMKAYLSEYGSADIASNGEAALAKIAEMEVKNEPFNIIFLDVLLPTINGIELMKKIREYENKSLLKEKKIIIISSTEEKKYMTAAKELNSYEYIVKPIDLDFLDIIMKRLNNSQKGGEDVHKTSIQDYDYR